MSQLTRGIIRRCPVCQQILANAEMGIRSHMKRHLRAGEIDEAQCIMYSDVLYLRERENFKK